MLTACRPLAQCRCPLRCPPYLLRSPSAGLLHCPLWCFPCLWCCFSAHLGPSSWCKSPIPALGYHSQLSDSLPFFFRCLSRGPSLTPPRPSRRCSRASKRLASAEFVLVYGSKKPRRVRKKEGVRSFNTVDWVDSYIVLGLCGFIYFWNGWSRSFRLSVLSGFFLLPTAAFCLC